MNTTYLFISLKGRNSWKKSSFVSIPYHFLFARLFATILFLMLLTPKTFAGFIIEKIYDFSKFGGDEAKLTVYNDKLYFAASEGNTGLELWASDGTQDGTYLVSDINPGAEGSFPTSLFVYNNKLYFGADDGKLGNELWTSDGTSTGTFLLKDINPTKGSFPAWMKIYHNQVYFSANHGEGNSVNRELWVSDGTPEGTKLVKDLNVGNSEVRWLTVYKDKLYFNASYGTSPRQFWASDGIDAWLLTNNPKGLYDPQEFLIFQDKLYFKANDQISGYEFWVMDGTPEGSYLIKDIDKISKKVDNSSDLSWLTIFNNRLYFRADDRVTGQELWSSDGTAEGTQLLKDINPVSRKGSKPEWFAIFDNRLFFTANDGISGQELWFTDGTFTGTQAFSEDVNPEGSSEARWLTVLNNRLYFVTSFPTALWVLYEPVPPTLVTSPLSQTLPAGQSVTLSVIATGDIPLSYQWYQGESGDTSLPIPEATSTGFTTSGLTTTTSYWVRVTNKVGSVDSATAKIIITSPPASAPSFSAANLPSSTVMPSHFTASVEVHGPGKIISSPAGLDCAWQHCQDTATGTACEAQQCSLKIPSLSTLLLVPYPESRAIFSSWGGDPDCEDGRITAQSSFLCIAYFHKLSKLTITGVEHGTVISSPEGIQCGSQRKQCEYFFEVGKEVRLSFVPDTFGRLNGWSGVCTQEGQVKISQTDQECSPQFLTLLQESIALSQHTTHSVQETQSDQITMAAVHPTAQDAQPIVTQSDAPPVTKPDELEPTYSLTITVVGEGTVITKDFTCSQKCTQSYSAGTKVLLTAKPAEGTTFVHWRGGCQGNDQNIEIDITQVRQCEVEFISSQQTLTDESVSPTLKEEENKVSPFPETVLLPPQPNRSFQEDIQPCLTEFGIITRACNAGGQTVSQALQVHRGVSFSHAVIDNSLTNEGWVSNLSITPRGTVTGGIVTGSISNQGIMRDFEFKGLSIVGGHLGGIISNHSQIGGVFQDVILEAQTYLSGGRLQGLIQGDPSAPARLEYVKVGAGSQLKNVQLGRGVKLENGVLLDKSVISVENLSLSCHLLGIHDEGVSDSQFFSVDDLNNVETFKVNPLGVLHKKLNLESFDIQPMTGKLYAASGSETSAPGHLYLVNPSNGELTDLGAIGFKQVKALSFHPDGILWGYAKGEGLFTMTSPSDLSTMKIILPSHEQLDIEEISWNIAGTTLYGVQNINDHNTKKNSKVSVLWAYNLEEGTFQVICNDLVHNMGQIEALETLPDDSIVLGFHNQKHLSLSKIDVETCQFLSRKEVSTPYNDVEGLVWEGCSLK